MTQYYFIKNGEKNGPFSKDELSRQQISLSTFVWFYSLQDWTRLSEIPELIDVVSSHASAGKKGTFNISYVFMGVAVLTLAAYFWPSAKIDKPEPSSVVANAPELSSVYRQISSSAFDSDVDFGMYVEKFYRDARFIGITPVRPKTTIIKFSPLDQMQGLAHIHGVSFGVDNDEKIEIYINPSTWETFNKPMRYVLMYHELAHDVLNLRDLDQAESNEEKLLMYPALADYRNFTMDEFIESYQTLFLEYKLQTP